MRRLTAHLDHKGMCKRGTSALVHKLVATMGLELAHKRETGPLVCEPVAWPAKARTSARQARLSGAGYCNGPQGRAQARDRRACAQASAHLGHKGARKRVTSPLVCELVATTGYKLARKCKTGALVCEVLATKARQARDKRACARAGPGNGPQGRAPA